MLANESVSKNSSNLSHNINKNIILAQNENIDSNSNQNTNSTESDSTSRDFSVTRVYDLGRIEKVVKYAPDSNEALSVITSKDIEDTMSNNIAESLRFSPGVFYTPYRSAGNRGEPSIQIRGFGMDNIGFFLDGIPVHSIYDKNTDWRQFSAFGLSEISISKGYTSPIYGMNTLGGAINMVTSKPMDKLEVGLKYGFMSNNEHIANVSIGSNLGQYYLQATYALDTMKTYPLSHKFTPTTAQPTLEMINSYYTNHTLRLKAGFEPNENHEYSLNFIYERGKKGGIKQVTSNTAPWKWPNYDKITAYLLGRSNITDMISLNTRLYYDSFYNILDNAHGSYKFKTKYDDFSVGLIETLGFDFTDNMNLKVGVNLRSDNHNRIEMLTSPEKEKELYDFSTSIFAEYAQRFNDMFRLVLSASYDRNDMLRAIIDYKPDKKSSLQGGSAQAVVYGDWSENITSWLNVGYKTSLPTLGLRYSTNMGYKIANPYLQPESAINAEFGTKLNYNTFLGTTSASLAVYYNDLTNMVVTVGVDGGCSQGTGCYKLENVKEGYSYGVEVGFSQGFWNDKITLGANYTYQQKITKSQMVANIRSSSGATTTFEPRKNRILNYPEHIANAMLSLTPFSQWDLIANLTYQSPQWSYNNGYSKNNSIFLVDLKTNLRIIDELQFSLGVSNVFDALYYYSDGYYMPGRRIFLSLEYKY